MCYLCNVALLFFTIFAILGVQLFKGGMERCVILTSGEVFYGVGEATCDVATGGLGVWKIGLFMFETNLYTFTQNKTKIKPKRM